MGALEIVGNVLIVLGALVFATAALGIVRFPDVFSRVSAVGTAGGLGIVFVIVGALLLQPSVSGTVKVVLIVLLQLATSAVGTMAVARSAYLTGVRMKQWSFDELDPSSSGRAPAGRDANEPDVDGRDQQRD